MMISKSAPFFFFVLLCFLYIRSGLLYCIGAARSTAAITTRAGARPLDGGDYHSGGRPPARRRRLPLGRAPARRPLGGGGPSAAAPSAAAPSAAAAPARRAPARRAPARRAPARRPIDGGGPLGGGPSAPSSHSREPGTVFFLFLFFACLFVLFFCVVLV